MALPETATTGFLWHPAVDEHVLEMVGDERLVPAVPRGAPGTRVITFKALRPGHSDVRLVKRRPWESEAHDEFTLHLDVAPAITVE